MFFLFQYFIVSNPFCLEYLVITNFILFIHSVCGLWHTCGFCNVLQDPVHKGMVAHRFCGLEGGGVGFLNEKSPLTGQLAASTILCAWLVWPSSQARVTLACFTQTAYGCAHCDKDQCKTSHCAKGRGQICPTILQNPGMDTFWPTEPLHPGKDTLILLKPSNLINISFFGKIYLQFPAF